MNDPDLSFAMPVGVDPDTVDAAERPPVPAVGFRQLEDVIADESFPEVDLALRRGRHIHKGDERWYEFLLEAQGLLEAFYRRYGCELEQRSDGYFFLLPLTDSLGKRHLGVAEMIVGQGLALCYLDPQSVQSGGLVTREELLNQLAAVMGTDALMRSLNPKRKRADERVMQRTVRNKVNDALRRLAQLGFVELLDGERLQLAPSLMRFAEPVRGLDAPSEALKRLIESGEISLGPGDPDVDVDVDETTAPHDAAPDLDPHQHPIPEDADANNAVPDDVNASDPDAGARDAEANDPDPLRLAAREPDPSLAPPDIDFEWDSMPEPPPEEPSSAEPPGEPHEEPPGEEA
jgi:chromosome partition protein MukE